MVQPVDEVGASDDWLLWNNRGSLFENWHAIPNVPTVPLYFFNALLSSAKLAHRRIRVG